LAASGMACEVEGTGAGKAVFPRVVRIDLRMSPSPHYRVKGHVWEWLAGANPRQNRGLREEWVGRLKRALGAIVWSGCVEFPMIRAGAGRWLLLCAMGGCW
jgi:hypothetical protein